MIVIATNNRSFLDIAVTAAGGIDSLFESALLSNMSIHEVPEVSSRLEIEVLPTKYSLARELPVLKPIQKLICVNHQNAQDLTIQSSGSLENIFEMSLLNGISITEETIPGQKYKAEFEAIEKDIVNYYEAKGIKPATGNHQTLYAVYDYVAQNYWI